MLGKIKRIHGSRVIVKDFTGQDLPNSDFLLTVGPATFTQAHLQGSAFMVALLAGSSFRYADLADCDFRYADLADCDFTGCALKGADFREAFLKGANFTGARGKALSWEGAFVDAATQLPRFPTGAWPLLVYDPQGDRYRQVKIRL